MDKETTELCVNTLRAFSADQPSAANSGHPGAPMGMSPMAHVLWTRYMKYSPANPKWINRDRFVLSNGHASALLYSLLHLTGFPLPIEEIKNFRQIGSLTPGHPESHLTPGVEVTTGPLGQGLANAVGLAIASKHMAATYNKDGFTLFNNKTWVFCGDGCLQEGITSEASSLAGHLGLSDLVVLYDDNLITIDGDTDLSFTEDVGKRYESYGWNVITVANGNDDYDAIGKAIEAAIAEKERPTFIKVRTLIGLGSAKAGTHGVHGSPLSADDLSNMKKKFGLNPDQKFQVPDKVAKIYGGMKAKGSELEAAWDTLFASYKEKYPDLAAELTRRFAGELPKGWDADLPTFTSDDAANATRKTSGIDVIPNFEKKLPEFFGGSADLNPSTFTYLKSSVDFQKKTPEGRNVRFGVREHAMASICNGLASYGGIIPYCSTFLNFVGYAFGAMTLSALAELQVIYIMTHDSIGVGEDGPTHQPVEKYAFCRATPNMLLIRPCDANETVGAYVVALENKTGPSVLSLTRQNVKQIKGSSRDGVAKGAYAVHNIPEKPDVILVASGSEVTLAADVADSLKDVNVKVVSMPCWKLYERQTPEYKKALFTKGVPVISIEAGVTTGWEKYAHASIGLNRFGLSGPGSKVFAELGFTVEKVSAKVKSAVEFYAKNDVPDLNNRPWNSSL
eukprot:TRINITY_DN6921_c0_g1_i1.p1 TRINITY_DN6921_c0_g1~~TRINITY_DN6921_c0_g1_i1.p1  ORF type:complete len:678 (+),score=105.36 TRINITY_DN6921_c0_g1_i1:31-2064(+)